MPAQQESWIATAYLQSGTISAGAVACLNAAGTKYLPATLENRTTEGRPSACIALSSADEDSNEGTGFEAQYVGVVPPAISLLGTGTATYVNVSDAGYLARTNTFDTSVVGRCDTDGTAYVCFPLAGIGPGGGGFTAGGDLTGDATTQTVAKIQGVAISGTAASGKTLVASGAAAASWQTPSSGAAPAGATGDIQVKQDATTFNVVGFWTAQDNVGKLRATYWDPVDGVTLRSCIEVSGGGAPFWPSEQYPSYGLFRLADSFHSTGGWSFLTVHDGFNTRGLLGLSLGNYFVGDSTGNIPTTIYGLSVQIVAGSGGASVQGGLKVGTLSVGTGTLATTGAVNFGTTGSFYFRPSGSDVSFLSVATTTLTLGIAAGTLALKHKTTSQLGADTGVTTTDAFDDFARVQTTDATTTSLYTFTLPTNSVTTIDIRVTACKSDTSSADAWVGTATFKNAAGTVATVAAANITHRGSTAWTVTIDNSTTTARVRVTGAAATTIEWAVEISYQVTRQS